MAIVFCGGELEDFVAQGTVAFSGSGMRAAYARGALEPAASTGGMTNFAKASFSTTASLAVTTQSRLNAIGFTANNVFLWLSIGGSARLGLQIVTTGASSAIALVSIDSGGTQTVLATSTLTVAANTIYRLDVLVDYQASGRVRLYVDQVLYLDYSGDVTASGATTLDALHLGSARGSTTSVWSEVIITDGEDSRPLSLKTLAPNAAGDTAAWTSGGYADIDETTASDLDLAISETANQVLAVNCTGMPTGGSGLSVRAVKAVAVAARGASGPSKLALGVRQSSTNGFATATTLDTGYGVVSTMWTTNPVTSAAFTAAEIDAIQLAYRSEA